MSAALVIPDYLNPHRDPIAWNSIVIAGFEIGPRNGDIMVTAVRGPTKYDWDRKKGKGTAGETSTFVGQPAADVEVDFEIWGPSGHDLFYRLLPILRHKYTGLSQAIEVEHPRLSLLHVHSVVVDEIDPPDFPVGLRCKASFKAHQYLPAPAISVVSTPVGTGGPDAASIPGTPTDPAVIASQKAYDDMRKDMQALPGGGNPFAAP